MKKIWEAWKRIAKKIGNFNARVLMTIFYFLFVSLVSIPVKIKDPLTLRAKRKSGWTPKPTAEGTPMEQGLRQF
jgi:hypothetical protein